MQIQLLYFDDCPNWEAAARLVDRLLETRGFDNRLELVNVDNPTAAQRWGFRGSPTVLIDGVDPFFDEAAPVGLSCRLYRTEDGLAGFPTAAELAAQLARAAPDR